MKRILGTAYAALVIIGSYCQAGQPSTKDPYELLSLNRRPLTRAEIRYAYSDALYRLQNNQTLAYREKVLLLTELDKAQDYLLAIRSETTERASSGANWNFELKNNTRYPIKVSLENNDGPIRLSGSEESELSIQGKRSSLPFSKDPVPLIRLSSVPTHLITTITIKNQNDRVLGVFELDSPSSRSFLLV